MRIIYIIALGVFLTLTGCRWQAMVDAGSEAQQWQVTELTFESSRDYPDPFDFKAVQFRAVFEGPGGTRINVPGYWDGVRTWRIKFTPTHPGRWRYQTTCTDETDTGLHGISGMLQVRPASGHQLHTHGGFLKVSANGRHLTCSDGTPFFYLADTWWTCPSARFPINDFRMLVDTRKKQGYTAFQAHGFRSFKEGGPNAFQSVQSPSDAALEYWRTVDQYYAYSDREGLLGLIGFYGGWSMTEFSYENHERLWYYFIARYGAYPISFLVTQEYNVKTAVTKDKGYDRQYVELGAFIKTTDPYKRAMTVHAWSHNNDNRLAWDEPWYDFIMLQGGHNNNVGPGFYWQIYFRPRPKPFLQSELNYEGFTHGNFRCDAACIRRSAYTAVQCGGLGFGYGAQGLYAGLRDKSNPGPTSRWGPVLSWDEGLKLPGGAQLAHFRAFYESLKWWELEPKPDACPSNYHVLVQSSGDRLFVIYFTAEAGKKETYLQGVRTHGAVYDASWFNPRDGVKTGIGCLTVQGKGLTLPPAPDVGDWLLVLNHRSGGDAPVIAVDTGDEEMPAWNFTNSRQGWYTNQDISECQARNNALCGKITGEDPSLFSPDGLNTSLSAKAVPRVEICMRNGTPLTNGRVYFRSSYAPNFEGNGVSFKMAPPSAGFVTYTIDMSRASCWIGRLLQLRIDPGDFRKSGLKASGDFSIRSVRMVAREPEN